MTNSIVVICSSFVCHISVYHCRNVFVLCTWHECLLLLLHAVHGYYVHSQGTPLHAVQTLCTTEVPGPHCKQRHPMFAFRIHERSCIVPRFVYFTGKWQALSHWVSLWADNFTTAERTVVLQSNSVFTYPIAAGALPDTIGQQLRPFVPDVRQSFFPDALPFPSVHGHPPPTSPTIAGRLSLQAMRHAIRNCTGPAGLLQHLVRGSLKRSPLASPPGTSPTAASDTPASSASQWLWGNPQSTPSALSHSTEDGPLDCGLHGPSPIVSVGPSRSAPSSTRPLASLAEGPGHSYALVATDVILSGRCFLQQHFASSGDVPLDCARHALGTDIHPLGYASDVEPPG